MAPVSSGVSTLLKVTPNSQLRLRPTTPTALHVEFPTPDFPPYSAGRTQEFRVQVRKNGDSNPLCRLELYENGAFVSTVLGDTPVTSTTGQVLSGTWRATLLSTSSGANVELRIVGTDLEGLSALEIGAIEWNAGRANPITATAGGASGEASSGGASAALVVSSGGSSGEALAGGSSATPIATGTDTALRVGFGTPSDTPRTGAGIQEFRVQVRKLGTGSNPTCKVELYETGGATPLAVVVPETAVSSTTGTVLSGTWDASLLSASNGSLVEARVSGAGAAGGTLEIGAIEWVATSGAQRPTSGGSLQEVRTGGADITHGVYTLPGQSGGAGFEARSGGASAHIVGVYEDGGDIWFADSVSWVDASFATGDVVIDLTASRGQAYDDTSFAGDVAVYLDPYAVGGGSIAEPLAGGGEVPQGSSVSLTGVDTDETIGTLTPQPDAATLALAGVASDESTGSLTSQPGTATLALSGVSTDETTGSLSPQPGTATVVLAGVVSDETTGGLVVLGQGTVGLVGVATDETVGTLTPIAGGASLSLTGVATDETVGTLSAVSFTNVQLTGVQTDETVGSPLLIPDDVALLLIGVDTNEVVGALTILTIPTSYPAQYVAIALAEDRVARVNTEDRTALAIR